MKGHRFIKGTHTCQVCWWSPQAPQPTGKLRRKVFNHRGSRCAYCGLLATTVDHLLPSSRGGTDALANLVPCCRPCNQAKADATPAEWLGAACPRRWLDVGRPQGDPGGSVRPPSARVLRHLAQCP